MIVIKPSVPVDLSSKRIYHYIIINWRWHVNWLTADIVEHHQYEWWWCESTYSHVKYKEEKGFY